MLYILAGVPGIAQVNKKIMIPLLSLLSVPMPPAPFALTVPGLHLPSSYSPFSIKVLVELQSVPMKLPVKVFV